MGNSLAPLDFHKVRSEFYAQRRIRLCGELENIGSTQVSQRNTMPMCLGLRRLRSSNLGTAIGVRCVSVGNGAGQGDALIFDVQLILGVM